MRLVKPNFCLNGCWRAGIEMVRRCWRGRPAARGRIWLKIVLLAGMIGVGMTPYALAQGDPPQPVQFFPWVSYQKPPAVWSDVSAWQAYRVQEGDTLFRLALRFRRPLHQMVCALPVGRDLRRPLVAGEILWIPPKNSVCHVVSEAMPLRVLARAYGSSEGDIVQAPPNGFVHPPYRLVPGQRVLIPLPPGREAEPWPYGTGRFLFPIIGVISQFWHPDHTGLDIAAPQGQPVVAADTGRVRWAGWDTTGYGWLVIIDHGNGYRTYYAHLDQIWVARGEVVLRGQPIGVVGTTGNSTGFHLHFEVRDYGRIIDPLSVVQP